MSKISIAMAIYNGESYLYDQLLSIYSQTRQPDELIACDDGSTDSSEMIFKSFTKDHKLESKWKYIRNISNKGYVNNFLDCAELCTGDIIFFSDQDDIWRKDKLELMEIVFTDNVDAMAVCCSVSCIDKDGNDCNTILNKVRIGNGTIKKVPFEKQVRDMISSGLTLAFRKETLYYMRRIIERYELKHDTPYGIIYAASGNFYRIYSPLVYRRVHENNESDPAYSVKKRMGNYERHIAGREMQLQLLNVCLKEREKFLSKKQKDKLKREIKNRKIAVAAMKNLELMPLIQQIFRVGKMNNKAIDFANLAVTLVRKRKSHE